MQRERVNDRNRKYEGNSFQVTHLDPFLSFPFSPTLSFSLSLFPFLTLSLKETHSLSSSLTSMNETIVEKEKGQDTWTPAATGQQKVLIYLSCTKTHLAEDFYCHAYFIDTLIHTLQSCLRWFSRRNSPFFLVIRSLLLNQHNKDWRKKSQIFVRRSTTLYSWQLYHNTIEKRNRNRGWVWNAIKNDSKRNQKLQVELHLHLDGSMRISTLWELAQKKKIKIGINGSLRDLEDAVRVRCPTDLKGFLSKWSVFNHIVA